MDWEGSEKVNVNVLKDNFVCRMSFLHNDFYRPSTWQGRHFFVTFHTVVPQVQSARRSFQRIVLMDAFQT